MTVEENLFVAVQAFRNEWLDHEGFVDVCQAWSRDKSVPLTTMLERRGSIDRDQRRQLEKLLESTARAGGVQQALAQLADPETRDTIRAVADQEVQQTLVGLGPEDRVRLGPIHKESDSHPRYELAREYGMGGLSRIWLARDANLHRDVILKELHPKLAEDGSARRRFLNEAHITGQLEHPNIVPVYELGAQSDADMPFYTMRFLRGDTLRKAIARHHTARQTRKETLENRRMLGIFMAVCNAIAYAHSRGVLHRDLKPENVVLGSYGEVILLDWGLAKVSGDREGAEAAVRVAPDHDPTLTIEGDILGTPAYLAPESAMGESDLVNERTDVYGLGGILFELLTGRAPHRGSTTGEVLRNILQEPAPIAREVNPNIPPALNAICSKAMAAKPEDRYPSALALLADVQRYLGDEPVSAYEEPLLARARRWMRHHRTTTALVAILLLGVLVAAGNLVWQRERAVATALEKLGGESREETGRLRGALDGLEKEARWLAEGPSVAGALQPVPWSDEAKAPSTSRGDLAKAFATFLQTHEDCLQVRLLDATGQELVRVERHPKTGEIITTWGGDLQDKSGSDYFEDALATPGRFYLSEVTLNKEDKKVQLPKTPVIRAVVRVTHADEKTGKALDGYLIVNRSFDPLFAMLQGEGSSEKGGFADAVCVTNERGEYLCNPHNEEWTFPTDLADLRKQQGLPPMTRAEEDACHIHREFPDLEDFFSSGRKTSVSTTAGTGDQRRAVHVYRVSLGEVKGRPRDLCIAATAPHATLVERAHDEADFALYTTICLIVALLAMVAWAILLTRRQDAAARAAAEQRDL